MTKQLDYISKVVRSGRPEYGWVNTPITRASTYVFENLAQWRDTRSRREDERLVSYGARGTDSTHSLEDALLALEGGHRAQLFPTGQAAIAIALMAYLRPGDHVLITDSVYQPVRRFCNYQLSKVGINFEFYRPDGSDIAQRIRPETRLIYVESPGSLTYEMVDLPAIVELAHQNNILVAVDNTWGSGLLYLPLDLGADISIVAATKYIGGHADVMMGAVICNEHSWMELQNASIGYGQTVGADDAYLALRGMRSLPARMAMHEQNAYAVMKWLQTRPEVAQVISPALPNHPSHDLWKAHCKGINGLFSVEFKPEINPQSIERMMDSLQLFGIGSSWGGFESLVLPVDLNSARSLSNYPFKGELIRLHVGLEHFSDLIADLDQAFNKLK